MSELDKVLNNMMTDKETAEESQALIDRERFETNMKNVWGFSNKGLEAKKAAMTMLSTKTGMYARIPLMCKAEDCPYANSCSLLEYDLAPFGEPCPIEVANIELRFAGYNKDFDLEEASFTDKNLVSEIINLDIMIERTKALIAKEGVPVIDVIAGIAENGEVYTRPEISKFLDAHDKLLTKRNNLYQLMMATRKDNKNKEDEVQSINSLLSELTNTTFVEEQRPEQFIDVEYSNK